MRPLPGRHPSALSRQQELRRLVAGAGSGPPPQRRDSAATGFAPAETARQGTRLRKCLPALRAWTAARLPAAAPTRIPQRGTRIPQRGCIPTRRPPPTAASLLSTRGGGLENLALGQAQCKDGEVGWGCAEGGRDSPPASPPGEGRKDGALHLPTRGSQPARADEALPLGTRPPRPELTGLDTESQGREVGGPVSRGDEPTDPVRMWGGDGTCDKDAFTKLQEGKIRGRCRLRTVAGAASRPGEPLLPSRAQHTPDRQPGRALSPCGGNPDTHSLQLGVRPSPGLCQVLAER